MGTAAGISIHVDPSEISHHYRPADGDRAEYANLVLGKPGYAAYANVFFVDTAAIDTAIAELIALRAEMDPPVITDSGRTCDQANPGTGAWCHRDGDHDEHRDTDGETWRTDEDRCECSHQKPEHGYYAIGTAPAAAHECSRPGCGCTVFRPAAPRPHAGPPAVVNGDVVLEVRALLP